MTYADKLRDPRWQKKRLEILQRDNFTCQHCHSTENQLHIHHVAYFKKEPWEIDDKLLITLCEYCHEFEQESVRESHNDLVTILKQNGFMAAQFHNLSQYIIQNGTSVLLGLVDGTNTND